jgi:uncharacterized repeat protein (TIGR01451 family)
VTALNGSLSSAALNFEVDNPVPAITQLFPATLPVGSAAILVVTGSGFVPSTTIAVNGSPRSTAYTSPTQVSVSLMTADLAAAATLALTATNPAPAGGASAAASLPVVSSSTPPPPAPVLSSVVPTSFIAGSPDSLLSVTGSNFDQNGVINWNGSPLKTEPLEFSGSGSTASYYLSATVPASLIASAGSASITVTEAAASPSVSNALPVSIVNPPAPTLTSISPAAGPIATAQTITLQGTGFTTKSTVSFNGVQLAAVASTSSFSTTQLTVTLPASAVSVPGNGSFTVTTSAPGGGTSAALLYTAYIGIATNSMVYNQANGLFYVSVPSSAGAPYGNSVVSVDPATGAIGSPIFVGSEPNQLALSSDGTILWVGLDGAGAVRQVNLSTGTAGTQFSLGGNSGLYDPPSTALSLAALPGSPNSVIVGSSSSYDSPTLAIYDSGTLRGSASTSFGFGFDYALRTDGGRNEIYAGGQSNYNTYTYSASGLTALATGASTGPFANGSSPEMTLASGRIYTDFGTVFDAESGSLLGTLYVTGQTPTSGSTTVDTTLGKVFVLDNPQLYSAQSPSQIQFFNTSDFNPTSAATLPVNIAPASGSYPSTTATGLTRWGANGLAFRSATGVYSFRSNLVKDLSTVSADLGVTLSGESSITIGTSATTTATVRNAGPSTATNVALTASVPASAVLTSVTPSAGSCATTPAVSCDLGFIASGQSVTVSFHLTATTSGTSSLSVQVLGSETDPNLQNNQASAPATVTGESYNLPPTVTAITPAAVEAGASDTVITVTGTGFSGVSSILLDGAALPTSVSADTLVATVPASKLASLGWSAVSVSNPAPGGGVSNALPLSVFDVLTVGLNHIVYDPFSRNIMATVGSGSSSVKGNSVVAIDPVTATIGTPVAIGSQPTELALTDDGQILYVILSGSQSVARYNMLTQQQEYTYTVPANSSFDGGIALRGIATQPGTENTIALDLAAFTGNAIYDFDPANQTAAIRGQASGPYSGSCIKFLDAGDLLAFDTDTSGATFDHYSVTAAGFTYYDYSQYSESTLNEFGCFQLSGGLAFANAGGVANPATSPATQLGVYSGNQGGEFSTVQNVAPDTSLQSVFFLQTLPDANDDNQYGFNAITAFNEFSFLPQLTIPVDFSAFEGTGTSYSPVDFIRWGQDGLALLTSGGHLYLFRGGAVVSGLMQRNPAATLSSSSSTSLTHGSGNTLLTLTGSGFLPGVAVQWNGSYRTTTILDATHVSVAIPSTDLASTGTGKLVAINPGAPSSGALTVQIN